MHQVKAHAPQEAKQLIQAPEHFFLFVNSQIEGFRGISTYIFVISFVQLPYILSRYKYAQAYYKCRLPHV